MSPNQQRILFATVLIAATAFWTPWWGTVLVVFVMALLSGFSTWLLTIASFTGWLIAIGLRDFLNEQGPSRTLIRIFSLPESFNLVAQPAVIALVAVVGACLGGSTAGLVNNLKKWREDAT